MKTNLILLSLFLAQATASFGQVTQGTRDTVSDHIQAATAAGFGVTDAGPHYRVWQKTEQVVGADGVPQNRTRSYTEMANGLNVIRNGAYFPAVAEWRTFQDGMVCDGTAH